MNTKGKELSRLRKKAHKKLVDSKLKAYEKFLELEKAAYADAALTRKTKLLIGLGISIVKNCDACMQWHLEEAAACGITREEVNDSIGVGIKMGGAPAVVSSRLILDLMDEVYTPKN